VRTKQIGGMPETNCVESFQ